MLNEFWTIFFWWLLIFQFNLPSLFFQQEFLSLLPDRGYAINKILGLVLVSLAVWLISSLKLLEFSVSISWLVFISISVLSLVAVLKNGLRNFRISRIMVFEELLFASGLILWIFVRAYSPDILGLEKFMDMSLVNASLNTKYFPPLDPWLSGSTVNYYYYGHFVTALLTKLSNIASNISYNLMIATIFGLSLSGAFSLCYNLLSLTKDKVNLKILQRKVIFLSLLAGILLTLGSNLHTIYAFTKGYQISDDNHFVVPPWNLIGQPNPQSYWYPSAVRMIPYAIHEFPAYSFVVADLHAHLLDIPFVLMTLTLLLAIFQKLHSQIIKKWHLLNDLKSFLPYLTILGLSLSVNYMTNSLDGAIYFGLFFLLLTITTFFREGTATEKIRFLFIFTFPVFVIMFLLTLPFTLNFSPFISGIGINCATNILKFFHQSSIQIGPLFLEANKCQQSPLYMLWILWGLPMFIFITYCFTLIRHKVTITVSDWFVLAATLMSAILIIFPEYFYFKDIYPLYFRANTMFKLGYQAFIILTIFIGYEIFKINFQNWFVRVIITLLIYCQILLVLIYPTFSVGSYYQGFKSFQSFDGAQYIQDKYFDDWAAVEWLRDHALESPVIVEAVGESYSNFARFSAFTGLPTIIGWPGHEWGWRKSGEIPYDRKAQVEKFYNGVDAKSAKEFLNKYSVKYIIVGLLERQTYTINDKVLNEVGKVVFRSGQTVIYQTKSG